MNREEMEKFKELNVVVKNVRRTVRKLMKEHLNEVNHNQSRRELELELFYKQIGFISKKWIIEILWELEIHQGLNFNEFMRHLKGISSRSLSDRLKTLKKINLITRTVQDTSPPKVLYELNDKGKGLVELSVPIIWHLFSYR